MGYDLHITRRKDWSSSGSDITADEWLAYVARDPELSLRPENGPYIVRWNGKCTHPDPWLNWFQGNVYTKNPDEILILKMVRVAIELKGKVQGDDGEIYRDRRDVEILPKRDASFGPRQPTELAAYAAALILHGKSANRKLGCWTRRRKSSQDGAERSRCP